VYELFVIDDALRALIHAGIDEGRLRETARANGMASMREDGERWVKAGVTSMDEVVRATRD
jgi:general secretion pathway protein E